MLLGKRAGDNGQVLAFAEALGWPYAVKRLAYNRLHVVPNILLGATARNLDRAESSPLDPPWPDLVLGIGKRSVATARWIRRQSAGWTRIVQLGRPRAPLADFDLLVTTPQYRLPRRPNVLELSLPLNRPDPLRTQEALTRWGERLGRLRRPLIAVMVGGNSRPYVLDPGTARRLALEASAQARETGGSLLVATSPRTPKAAADTLFAAIDGPAEVYRWRPADEDNPYLAYLGCADRLLVTGDSASLLAEACATGRPVEIFPLPTRPLGFIRRPAAGKPPRGHRTRGQQPRQGPLASLRGALADAGLLTPRRDLGALHRVVVSHGLASWAGEGKHARAVRVESSRNDLQQAVRRVRDLFTLRVPRADPEARRGRPWPTLDPVPAGLLDPRGTSRSGEDRETSVYR